MSTPEPSFPDNVWDGLSRNPNRKDRRHESAPDSLDWDRVVSEIIAMQSNSIADKVRSLFGIFQVSDYMTKARAAGQGAGTVNDWDAFNACVNDCIAAKGGIIEVDVPIWIKGASSTGSWAGGTGKASHIVFRGRADASPITLDCDGAVPFNPSNFSTIRFENLVFVGGSAGADVTALYHGYSSQTTFVGCTFAGLKSSGPLLSFFSGQTGTLWDCRFGGCGALSVGLIRAYLSAGLVVDSCEFSDFGDVRGVAYSSKTNPLIPWIWYRGNSTTGAGLRPTSYNLHMRNCFFDEGRSLTLDCGKDVAESPRIRSIVIENCRNNLTPPGGYKIAGVETVLITDNEFAWNPDGYAIQLRDVRFASIQRSIANTLGGGTAEIDADDTVDSVEILECTRMPKISGWGALQTTERYNGVDVT